MNDPKGAVQEKEQLDVLSLRYFSLLEDLLQLRLALSNILKKGFFSISKAKYSMGPLCVSPLQYPQRMLSSAFLNVDCKYTAECTNTCISLSRNIPPHTPEHAPLLRKRGVKNVESISEKEGRDEEKKESEGDDRSTGDDNPVQKDPLLWFGVLVSPHLRQAQKDFQKALDLIVEITNVTHHMSELQNQFSNMKQTLQTE